jgi:hypothetical protein
MPILLHLLATVLLVMLISLTLYKSVSCRSVSRRPLYAVVSLECLFLALCWDGGWDSRL